MIQQLIHRLILHIPHPYPFPRNRSWPYRDYDRHQFCSKIATAHHKATYDSSIMSHRLWLMPHDYSGSLAIIWSAIRGKGISHIIKHSRIVLTARVNLWHNLTSNELKSNELKWSIWITLLICAWFFGTIVNWNQIIIIIIQSIFLEIFYQSFWIAFLYLTT